MIEIESQGRWPVNAVADINKARAILEDHGHAPLILPPLFWHYVPVEVRALPKICEELNNFIIGTNVSYRGFFEKNKIANIKEDGRVKDFTAIVSFNDDKVRVNNVQLASEYISDLGENSE